MLAAAPGAVLSLGRHIRVGQAAGELTPLRARATLPTRPGHGPGCTELAPAASKEDRQRVRRQGSEGGFGKPGKSTNECRLIHGVMTLELSKRRGARDGGTRRFVTAMAATVSLCATKIPPLNYSCIIKIATHLFCFGSREKA